MKKTLPTGFSAYLDLIRISAATVVLISHYPITSTQAYITNSTNYAYDAVVVFFVLSGYVIAYAAEKVDKTGKQFFINRAARIMPVTLAAIAISWISMRTGLQLRPELYHDTHQLENPLKYALVSGLFLNQIWWLNIGSFNNGPYWSLTYEVAYYAIYGVALFSGKHRLKWSLLVVILVGPKIAIMFIVWVLGAICYKLRDMGTHNPYILWAFLIFPNIAYVLATSYLPWDWSYPYSGSKLSHLLGHGLEGAANFGWAYILAILFSIHLYAARKLSMRIKISDDNVLVKVLKKFASYTFTLYIIHYPIIFLARALLGTHADAYDINYRTFVLLIVVGTVVITAKLFEHPKKYYKSLLTNAVLLLSGQLFRQSIIPKNTRGNRNKTRQDEEAAQSESKKKT